MDSYEFYLLYHKDSSGFIAALSEKNDEILIALEKLIENNKITFDTEKESCFKAVWELLLHQKEFSDRLDNIFAALLTVERFDCSVKYWILQTIAKFEHDAEKSQEHSLKLLLRIIRSLISKKFPTLPSTEGFFRELTTKLVELLYSFNQTSVHHDILNTLHQLMKEDSVNTWVLNLIATRSETTDEQLSLQNLCYFFDKMCELKSIHDYFKILHKYFDSSEKTAKKQGIFLLNILIRHQIFKEDEESFKKLIIIAESLEESQSHLVLPTLELLKDLKFSEQFKDLSWLLLKMIITHENNLVKNWGLKFVLSSEASITDEQCIVILNTLNSTCLYGPNEAIIDATSLMRFSKNNFVVIFKNLVEVNWMSAPFYRLLEQISDCISSMKLHQFDYNFISTLQKHTELLPKRVKNLAIRSGVQKLYANILTRLLNQGVQFESLVQSLVNVFNMGKHCKSLENCLRLIKLEDHEFIFTDNQPEKFVKFALTAISNEKSLAEIKEAAKRISNYNQILMDTVADLNKIDKCYENELIFLIHETIEDLYTNAVDEDAESFMRNIDILNVGLQASNSPIEAEMHEHLLEVWRNVQQQFKKDEKFTSIYWSLLKLILGYNQGFDVSMVEKEVFDNKAVSSVTIECQRLILQHHQRVGDTVDEEKFSIFLQNFESFVDECYKWDDVDSALSITRLLIVDGMISNSTEKQHHLMRIMEKLLDTVINTDDRTQLLKELTKVSLKSAELLQTTTEWINHITKVLQKMISKLNGAEKLMIFSLILEAVKSSATIKKENSLRNFVKRLLIEKMIETDMLTSDQQ